MDWEFPATRGSPPEDKYRFTYLMKGLYEAFAEEAKESGKEKLILTLAAASGTYYIDQSYEPKKIINYIDYMLLMTYNYHGQWEKKLDTTVDCTPITMTLRLVRSLSYTR
uniref:GH18 domain-containing protein n=1 Tax=Biomphalaria glabrata TaxID=6526 RepID=A0A2C9LZW9_BIOGL